MSKLLPLLVLIISGWSTAVIAVSPDIRACRGIKDPLGRVACYDLVVDSQTDLTPTQAMPATREDPSLEPQDVPVLVEMDRPAPAPDTSLPGDRRPEDSTRDLSEELFGKQQAELKQTIRDQLNLQQVDSLTVGIEEVGRTAFKKLLLVLDNDQVWVQISSEKLNLKPNDQVTIRTAASGSYLLEKSTGSRSIRVKRLK